MTNLGLIRYNKRFLYAAVGAPASAHMLDYWKSHLYILISLMEMWFRIVPFAWLIKASNENTRDNQKKYFNKRLCGTRESSLKMHMAC